MSASSPSFSSLTSDDLLLTALQAGNHDAFAAIYDRYWSALYRLAYQKVRSREGAEELVQELFVSLWANRHRTTIQQLRPYLFSALRFSVIDSIESQRVQERFISYYESFLLQTSEPPADTLGLRDLTNAIEETLRPLPEKSQLVFRLSRFEQLSIPEIADRLGLSEKAIEYHLARALKAVRAQLRDIATIAALIQLAEEI
ncbi:sigma-70 family RNA polymerase sigma factor [Spirosoma luteolum]